MKKRNFFVVCAIVLVTLVCCISLESIEFAFAPKQERYIDHVANRGADSSIGLKEIPADGIVDESFTSHLPLIIIDTGGKEIINYKTYNSDTDAFEEPEDIDPYFNMTLSVIDNDNHVNSLADVRTIETQGEIKVRGNSSSSKSLPKYQYTVKLFDENGDNADISLLGMGAENRWILNPTVRDLSYIRNYLAYNIAGQIEPYQSDVRYCEVLFKNGKQYEYIGLYMLYEPVEVSENRVNIKKDVSRYNLGQGYLLKKDRFDKTAVTLDTWATQETYYISEDGGKSVGSYFMLEYPANEDATKEVVENITNEISEIERILYNTDLRSYNLLEQKLDMDSFVDFFIINEFFASYDAGQHSTYMYKSAEGKLTMGPYWDFDGAMDNSRMSLTNTNYMVLPYRPWFDCLVKLEKFTDKLEKRYKELRKTLLNEEYIDSFIDETIAYLGNARLRDRSMYSEYYYDLDIVDEEVTGLSIDRRRYTTEDEVLRIKDFLHEHGEYMDEHISGLKQFAEDARKTTIYNTVAGCGFIVLIIVVIVVAQRYRNNM